MKVRAVQAPKPEPRQNGKVRTAALALIVFFAKRVAGEYTTKGVALGAFKGAFPDRRNGYPLVLANKAHRLP